MLGLSIAVNAIAADSSSGSAWCYYLRLFLLMRNASTAMIRVIAIMITNSLSMLKSISNKPTIYKPLLS